MSISDDPATVSKGVCHKLECLGDFLTGYSSIIHAPDYCYLELFTRHRFVKCRNTGTVIPASCERALRGDPPFGRYVLAIQPSNRLIDFGSPAGNVLIERNNPIYRDTLHRIFDFIPRSSNIVCILDLPGYRHLRWSTMRKLITSGTNWDGYRMDLLVLLPVEMALLKNISRPECASSINRFFGTSSWQVAASQLSGDLNHKELEQKLGKMYTVGLAQTGYKYTGGFSPNRFGASQYYVIWASDRHNWLDELKKIWNKPRFLPGEMFHRQ